MIAEYETTTEKIVLPPPEGSISHLTGWGKVTERSDFLPVLRKSKYHAEPQIFVNTHTCAEAAKHTKCLQKNKELNRSFKETLKFLKSRKEAARLAHAAA